MKPGQFLVGWWQEYVAGRLRTPRDIVQASKSENPFPDAEMREFFEVSDKPSEAAGLAPSRLMFPAFFNSPAHLRQMERADWQHVPPLLQKWAAMLQEYARKRGVPLYVHSAFRTEEQQDRLLQRGVTKALYPRSAHNIGEAVDIVHGVLHWDLTAKEWQMLHLWGRIVLDRLNAPLPKAERLLLNWGGDDGTPEDRFRWDPAHWEILDFRSRIKKLPAGPPLRRTPRYVLRHL